MNFSLLFDFLGNCDRNIDRVLFFAPVQVRFYTFIQCCMHVDSFFFFTSFSKQSIHFWPMLPFSHQGNTGQPEVFCRSQRLKKENIGLKWVLTFESFDFCFLLVSFFHPERYDLNEIIGSIISERVSLQSRQENVTGKSQNERVVRLSLVS